MIISKMLKSPWWQLINSAIIIFLLTTILKTCQKTKDLEVAINNSNTLSVENKNEVKIINQSVTKVEKEIANINETIHQFISAIINEVFRKDDENIKIKLIPIPELENKSASLFFMLNKIPQPKSIKIITNKGVVVPYTTLRTNKNIIMVNISGLSTLFPDNKDYYEVSYIPDFFEKKPLLSLEDIEIEKVDKGIYEFKLKEK